jgi:hypothetical protein
MPSQRYDRASATFGLLSPTGVLWCIFAPILVEADQKYTANQANFFSKRDLVGFWAIALKS